MYPPLSTGKQVMSAMVPIRPDYPDLRTLDSLFNEGPVSFAKLAAEAARRRDETPYQFVYGVSLEDTDFLHVKEVHRGMCMQNLMEEKQREREKEERKREAAKRESERKRKAKLKKMKVVEQKMSSIDDIDEALEPILPANGRSSLSSTTKSASTKSDLTKKAGETSVATETKTSKKTAPLVPEFSGGKLSVAVEALEQNSIDAKYRTGKTARDKFRRCEHCDQEIVERIQLCSGCKKVAYCDLNCQRLHWKQHKKTCSYTQKKDKKMRHCEHCDQEIVERIQLCSGCKKVAYCDLTCQKSHWKLHKKTCSYTQKKTTG